MAFSMSTLTDLPGGQQVETHPALSIALHNENLAGGANVLVNHQGAASNDWLIGVRSAVTWWFLVLKGLGNSPGVTLQIELAHDATLGFYEYNWYALPAGTVSTMTNLVLPGVLARFRLINAHATDTVEIQGIIKVQAGF